MGAGSPDPIIGVVPNLKRSRLLRGAVEDIRVQVAFHAMGGAGAGLIAAQFMPASVAFTCGLCLLQQPSPATGTPSGATQTSRRAQARGAPAALGGWREGAHLTQGRAPPVPVVPPRCCRSSAA